MFYIRIFLKSSVYRKNRHLLKLLFHADKPLMGLVSECSPFDINDSELNRTTIDTIDVKVMDDSHGETDHEDEENSDSASDI